MKSNIRHRLYKGTSIPLREDLGSVTLGKQPGTLELNLGFSSSAKFSSALYSFNAVNTYLGNLAKYGINVLQGKMRGLLGTTSRYFSLTDLFGSDAYTCFRGKKNKKKRNKHLDFGGVDSGGGGKRKMSKKEKRSLARKKDEEEKSRKAFRREGMRESEVNKAMHILRERKREMKENKKK